jgi:hypothetical protein
MTWKRFTRRDTCPVCNGQRHDCRQNLETHLVHCRSNEANPLDYIYRGQDTWGFNLWAYKPDADEWASRSREEWLEEQQRKRSLKEQQEREQLKKLLPIKERDQVIRAILEQLTLSDDHRQRLKARGLTDLQISEAGYRSVKQWQKLSQPVTNKLSGVKIDGNSLINHTDGILIPIPNEDGLYTLLRVNDCSPDTTHKYYPLSSAKRGVKYHLASGEQPIAVYFPDFGDKGTRGQGDKEARGNSLTLSPPHLVTPSPISPSSPQKTPAKPPEKQIIGFTEGLEYKPLLTAKKLGIPVIGASGGNFASSQQTILQAITKIKAKGDSDEYEYVLYADAGSAINPNVTRHYEKLGEFIPDLKIADWGQLTSKEKQDIDEIDPTQTNIKLIPLKEFLERAKKEQYKIKTRLAWQQSKRFTPTAIIEDDSQYLNLPTPKDNSMVFINAGLGTGKTTNLIEWLHGEWKDYGAISLGYRNTLLIQFCKKSGFIHIHEGDSQFYIKDSQGRVAACINSYFRFSPDDFEDKILILDEIVSIIKHLLFSNTISNRGEAISLFFEAIRKARVVVNMDGNLTDIYCDFLAKIDPSKAIQKIKKIDKSKKPELILLEGTIKNERIRKRDHSPWLYDLLNILKMIACVASDSQILLESLDIIVQEKNAKTLRVDSKTINQKKVKEFLENPIEWLKKNPIDYLFISPSCESGLDIPLTDYFTHFFGFFFGKLDPDSITQIIARVRDAELTRYLWVAPFVKQDNPDSINSSLVESVKYHYNQRITRDIHGVLSGEVNSEAIISELLSIIQEAQNALETEISQKLQAANNYEKANLRDCTYWLLEQQGYDVSHRVAHDYNAALFDDPKNQVSSEKKEVKHQNCHDIINSSDKYIGQPSIRLNFDAAWEDRCALIKAKIIDRVPGINHHTVWSENFIYQIRYEHPNLITQLEDRYLLDNLNKCKDKSKRIYHKQLVKGRQGKKLTPWKLTPRYQRLKALHDVGIHDLIHNHYGVELTADNPIVQTIIAKCRRKKYWQALGKKPHSDTMKYLKWLLQQIGYDLTNRKVKNSDGKVIRVFSLSSVPHKDVAPYITPIMEAIAQKYEQTQPEINWEEGRESMLQDDICSIENGENLNQKVFSAENGDNQHQLRDTTVDDPPKILREDWPHRQPNTDTTIKANLDINIEEMEATRDPNLDINSRKIETTTDTARDINIGDIESVSEVPIEAIPFEDYQFIANLISDSQTVEDIKFLRDESGLTIEQLQLGWNLLPPSEKERLRPLFAQLKNPEPFPIGQKIKARLQHFTGQWMRLIGEVVEFLTNSGEIHKQLRTADGSEYPLRVRTSQAVTRGNLA